MLSVIFTFSRHYHIVVVDRVASQLPAVPVTKLITFSLFNQSLLLHGSLAVTSTGTVFMVLCKNVTVC